MFHSSLHPLCLVGAQEMFAEYVGKPMNTRSEWKGTKLRFPFTLERKGQAPFQSCLKVLFFSLNGKVGVGVLALFILFANTDSTPGVPFG